MFNFVGEAVLDGLQGGISFLVIYLMASTVRDIWLVIRGKR